ncbi:MAG TPA: VOC family protein [Kribbella sp.]|uniref:VOC family protein n=1 Tax=Kribbella sp. TaxID=1871183 RepID=UPI002D79F464|nr:VOC family protein [Kribbella sp.]HET6296514.1 VOC family protein [Kribbella sp.]
MAKTKLGEFERAGGVEDWRVLEVGASAWFDAPSQTVGAELVGRIAEVTDALPDVDLRAGGVRVRIGVTGLTRDDVVLARAVSATAKELGLVADPAALQTVQLVIDAVDKHSVMSFWRTALAYEPLGDDCLADPLRRDPVISFQRQDQPQPLRNRIHVDIVRAPAAVEAVRAVAGHEPYGAYQLTLADADGNEIDLVPGAVLSEGPETADWGTLFGAMTFYPTASPVQAVELAKDVAGLSDAADVPLLVDLRPDGVTIDSGKDQWEDDVLGAGRFADLASRIQTTAHELGLSADKTRPRFVQLGMDAVDIPAVQAFWMTVLGYQHDGRPFLSDIYDPRRLNPVIFFQKLDAADEDRRRQRNRIHLDLYVPYDQAQARIETAISAGGRILTGKTPGRCTIADPEGNELDIVTHS